MQTSCGRIGWALWGLSLGLAMVGARGETGSSSGAVAKPDAVASVAGRALGPAEIAAGLATLPGWAEKDGMISKTYLFPGFSDAVAFIVRISHPLEALNHHPEIRNVYGMVKIGFTTHNLGDKLGPLDFKAARLVEDAASILPQKKAAQP